MVKSISTLLLSLSVALPAFGQMFDYGDMAWFGVVATPASGATTNYTLTLPDDAFYYSGDADVNYNTASLTLRSGQYRRTAVIRFSFATVAANDIITGATLYLYQAATANITHHVSIYRILPANSAWTESSVTWNHAVTGVTRWAGDTGADGGADAGCSVSGTDYSATAIGTFTITAANVAGTEYAITLNVSEVNAMRSDNAGMVIIDTDGSTNTDSLGSSENTTAALRPKLVLTCETQ